MLRDFAAGFSALNALWLLPIFLVGVAVYVVCRLRERNGPPDPHIGIKTSHHLFYTAGLLLLLTGVSMISVEMMNLDADHRRFGDFGPFGRGGFAQEPFFERGAVRAGLAFMLVGGAFALLHRLLLLGTNDGSMRNVNRAFLAVRFGVSGLTVMFILTIMLAQFFQRGSEFRDIKPFLGLLIVWMPAWILFMTFLLIGTPRGSATSDLGGESRGSFYEDEGPERFR